MPYNVAAGDSAGMNFASGRLDRLTWRKVLQIRQKDVERRIMFKMFTSWWQNAILVEGLLPQRVRRANYMPKFKWYFDGDVAIDPQKESKSDETDLKSKATTFATVFARKGKNWKEEMQQQADEKAEMQRLGLTVEDVTPTVVEPTAEDVDAKIEDMVNEILDERLSK
jgi:capsid protein